VWLGFWTVLVDPSLKFHCHDVGFPTDASANCTDWPVAGEAGLKVKDAVNVTVGATVTVRLVLPWPDAFITVRLTVYDPAVG
jgi:hypothetical protein